MKKLSVIKEYWPVIVILSIFPFLMRMHEYTLSAMDESWYVLGSSALTDFFFYLKMIIFLAITCVMIFEIIFYFISGKKEQKLPKPWIFMAVFVGLILLSAILTRDSYSTFHAAYDRFETVFVEVAYMIACFYAFLFLRDTKMLDIISKIVLAVSAIMIVLGFLQISGHDPFMMKSVQKMIIPSAYWKDAIGSIESVLAKKSVYLTLANPNYASMFLAMIMTFTAGMLFHKDKKIRIAAGILEACLVVLLVFTYSRVGFFMLIISGLAGTFVKRNVLRSFWKQIVCVLIAVIVLTVGADVLTGSHMIHRLQDTMKTVSGNSSTKGLQDITTSEDGIKVTYKGTTKTFTYAIGTDVPMEKIEGWDDVYEYTQVVDDERFFCLLLDDTEWRFTNDDVNGYMIYTGDGKYDTVSSVDHLNLHGKEALASGRGYIWSRTIPLLKKYGLFGSGPNTFYKVFPQNDYVGKALYAKSCFTIIEKPHNMYLQLAVENGIPALICFLIFVGWYLLDSLKLYAKADDLDGRYGFCIFLLVVGYMAGGLFNDFSIVMTPMFFVMLGMGIKINMEIKAK